MATKSWLHAWQRRPKLPNSFKSIMGGKYGNGQGQNNPQEMLAEAQILLVAGIPTSPLNQMITDSAIISF